jgi:transposase
MMNCTVFGLDLAKRVFQLHWIEMETGEICRRQLKRQQVAEFFANRRSCVIAMEACGSAHYWGRKFAAMGHEVRLIAAQFVRPFVKSNKTDVADAQAIWEAAQRPDMKFVALKTEEQQSVLTLHRMREQLVKMRTMQINQLRGLLYEFGVALPQGRQKGMARITEELGRLEDSLSAMFIDAIREQLRRIEIFNQDIVCRFPWPGSTAEWYRRASEAAGDQQKGRCISADPADPWSTLGNSASERAYALAGKSAITATTQCSICGAG